MRFSRATLVELFSYGLGTGVAFAVDFALLTTLVSLLGVPVIAATAISFVVGGVVLYLLSVRYVFRHRRIANQKVELSYFVALGVAGLVIQIIVMTVAVQYLQVYYLIAKLAAAACTFFVNYILRRSLLFTAPPSAVAVSRDGT